MPQPVKTSSLLSMQDEANQQTQCTRVEAQILVVTKSSGFARVVERVNEILRARRKTESLSIEEGEWNQLFSSAAHRAIDFLDLRKFAPCFNLIVSPSLGQAIHDIHQSANRVPVAMLIYDIASCEDIDPESAVSAGHSAMADLTRDEFPVARTPESILVYHHPEQRQRKPHFRLQGVTRELPDDDSLLATDLLSHLMALTQALVIGRSRYAMSSIPPPVTLGEALSDFLIAEADNDWALFYYTGSIISNLIDSLEQKLGPRGIPCLRGPSEHSLACGALAQWKLWGKPSLVIVTSGMLDEFKGTLANLRDAGAQGFIVCAENRPDQWFAFQGTISAAEDIREVLTAKRIPYVYLEKVEALADYLEKAFELYRAGRGPVVLLATQQVLESTAPLNRQPGSAPAIDNTSTDASLRNELERVIHILNHEEVQLLWQCERLDSEESQLVQEIAGSCGAAVVDSLTHPGSVAKFQNGQLVKNYLGTLGLYGFSDAVYRFTHTNGQLNPKESQCFFFLNSEVPQVATPFSRATMQNRMRMVQVTCNPENFCPWAEVKIGLKVKEFLFAIRERVKVEPHILAMRDNAINKCVETPSDITSQLPVVPMQPSYFISELNRIIEDKILREGYRYVGLYDVGRCGISAVRNTSRTGPGFSGWYGRALMGDALMAVPSVAVTSKLPVIAFVGDGAKALAPDVLPSLVESARKTPERFTPNLTVFYFLNGNHSLIESYQAFQSRVSGRQMQLMNIVAPEAEEIHGGIHFRHFIVEHFDADLIRSALLEDHCVNIFSVFVDHNNRGDGLSLLMPLSWEYCLPQEEE
jgi:thiamine pyrophosphate-dependent acetolactate synthase large subunit-like protein